MYILISADPCSVRGHLAVRTTPSGPPPWSPPSPLLGEGCVQISGLWIPSGIPLTREWVNSLPSWPDPALDQKDHNFQSLFG